MIKFKQLISKIINNTKKIIEKNYLFQIIVGMSFLIVTLAIIIKQYNIALLGIMILWIYNIIFGLCKLKNRLIFYICNYLIVQ